MPRHILPALLAVLLAGCAGFPTIDQERQSVSSGFIGCAPADIAISDNAQYTWIATCKSVKFMCTAAPNASCGKAL
ncbi:hypothetical protein GN316_06700 [Xylophilus sp. Kf1]|nr:hypothetical protein [Xylophilus sp. Kf1]